MTVARADVRIATGPPLIDQSETSIAVSGRTVVVGYNDQRFFFAAAGYAYSTDGGVTWTEGGLLPLENPDDTSAGDPAVVACGDAFYYATLYFHSRRGSSVAVYRGTVAAGILSWGPPQIAAAATEATVTPQDFLDKDYIACDPSTGALYVAYTRFIGGFNPGARRRVELARSTSMGATWSPPTLVTPASKRGEGRFGIIPQVGARGELYLLAALVTNKGRTRRCEITVSENQGATFSRWRRVPGCGGEPVDGTRLQLPSLVVDRRVPGLLYVAYAAGDRGHGEIFVTRSLNGGRSFRRPVHVSTGGRGSDQFFPWLATDPIDGEVTVIWYDRHLPPVNLGLDVFYARSRDGTRFGEVRRLTSTNARPGMAALDVGDYIGVVSDGSGSYAAWADGRAGGDWDIYFGFVPK